MNTDDLENDTRLITPQIRTAYNAQDYERFLPLAEAFREAHPQNHVIDIFHGIFLEEQEKYEEAITCFDRGLTTYPVFSPLEKNRGRCYLWIKSYSLARDSFKEYLRFKRDDPEAWAFLTLSYFLEGKKELALALIEHALTEVEQTSLLLLLRGILYEKEGMDTDALISYIQSQLAAQDDEDRELAGDFMFRVNNKKE